MIKMMKSMQPGAGTGAGEASGCTSRAPTAAQEAKVPTPQNIYYVTSRSFIIMNNNNNNKNNDKNNDNKTNTNIIITIK